MIGSKWHHNKRGTDYTVIAVKEAMSSILSDGAFYQKLYTRQGYLDDVMVQVSNPEAAPDSDWWVYQNTEGEKFIRPANEFVEPRFTKVTDGKPRIRIITVQFAVPQDDPAFKLTHLHDEIQSNLYDVEGMAGSFKILGAVGAKVVDPSKVFDTDHLVVRNAETIIEQEAKEAKEAERKREEVDLEQLERWAKDLAMNVYSKSLLGLDKNQRSFLKRMEHLDYIKTVGDRPVITNTGFEAIGWR